GPHERVMLENVFQGGETTKLSSLKNRFYTALPVIREDIFSELRNKGMYLVDPESANSYVMGAVVLIAIPFVIAQFTGAMSFFESVPLAILALAIAAIIVFLFGRKMSAKTLQ